MRIRTLVGLLGLLVALAGCGAPPRADLPAATALPATPTVERARLSAELRIFNWQDYIDPQVIRQFEAEYGVRVTIDTYRSNEELLQKVQSDGSGYDLVVPSAYMAATMIQRKRLAPLDRSHMVNLGHVGLVFQDTWFDPQGRYCVPYMWGSSGIAYDSAVVPEPTSWGALLNPAPALKGRISMLDDQREVLGAALRYLGYSLNTASAQELGAALALLKAQRPSLLAYTSDAGLILDKLASGELVLAHVWAGTALQAAARRPSIKYVVPREGAVLWQDCMAVLQDAPHRYTAEVFLNFLNRPEIAAANASYLKYSTTNDAAFLLLPPELKRNTTLYPEPEVMLRLERIRPAGDAQQLYDRVWRALRGPSP